MRTFVLSHRWQTRLSKRVFRQSRVISLAGFGTDGTLILARVPGSFNRVLQLDRGDVIELSLTHNIQPSALRVSRVIIECKGSHTAT